MQRNSHPLILTWADFDQAVERIAGTIRAHAGQHDAQPVTTVCGLPRGGLPLAVALSHALEVPFDPVPIAGRMGQLIVDDIVETGSTLAQFLGQSYIWVWIAKGWVQPGVHYIERVHPYQWVVFPWESADQWATDANHYTEARHGSTADQ